MPCKLMFCVVEGVLIETGSLGTGSGLMHAACSTDTLRPDQARQQRAAPVGQNRHWQALF